MQGTLQIVLTSGDGTALISHSNFAVCPSSKISGTGFLVTFGPWPVGLSTNHTKTRVKHAKEKKSEKLSYRYYVKK